MNDFIKNNGMSILIGTLTLVSTYSLYGYRITQAEGQVRDLKNHMDIMYQLSERIATLDERVKGIQEDVSEIKEALE